MAVLQTFVALALRHGLPIVAANVSRADARRMMNEGLKPLGFDERVPDDINAARAQAIVDSHCGAMDAAQGLRMASAQVARYQFMAQLIERHAGRGFVLLAGNGDVRRDIGVPRWLSPELARRLQAISLLEDGDTERSAYDDVVVTPQSREDPCGGMRPVPQRKTSWPLFRERLEMPTGF